MSSSIAQKKKQNLIKIKLSEILYREMDNPRINSISISRVEVSKGLESVQVFFTSFLTNAPPQKLEKELNEIAGLIRYKLTKALKTRSVPFPVFIYDRSIDKIDKIDRILKTIHTSN